jgi:hypothetical protein
MESYCKESDNVRFSREVIAGVEKATTVRKVEVTFAHRRGD